ncbi:unnamed protein product (macronuclear) [Paramecium tetraurelia]|uniref:Uncharacterized protein n=1 Tax=Paramecium tetraurelia TaxID=5888 RepID=A0DKY7_PARTE|nr:uncharacterized protein GSPATT00018021001 [Paramecium tetraurelia]CAK83704.1 unnamed protein product [Paramecium tetraurelia]|eukprot:XP_001451101.1 hypothetical protein (macronuclear) [Paramecium tetraurelia strain d4-2]
MQYYIPTKDVLGALSDVFSKCNYQFDSSKRSESFEKLASAFQSKLDTNKFKSNLDNLILEKIQSQDENDGSLYLTSQCNDISNKNEQQMTGLLNSIPSKAPPETFDQQIQTDTLISSEAPGVLVDNGCQIIVEKMPQPILQLKRRVQKQRIKINQIYLVKKSLFKFRVFKLNYNNSDFSCQVEQLQEDSQNNLLNQRLENNSDQQQQSYHSSDLIDNLQIIHDQINEECVKCPCGKSFLLSKKKLIDAECQYDRSPNTKQSIRMNDLDLELEEKFKHIRIRSRCMSQTNQINDKMQINDEDQITFLENELQLKSELLETKNQAIFKLHSQIEDLHKLIIDQKDSARNLNNSDSDISNERDDGKYENLQLQIQTGTDIQDQLTKQMIQYSEENRNLQEQLRDVRDQNQDLKEELDKLTIQLTQLKHYQAEQEENKAKEIDIINEDYQDKLSKQNMIIDDLQQQISSISGSPMGLNQLSMPQTMKYISQQQQTLGSDSQQSKGSNSKTQEEKQQFMRNFKKMTSMTAGLMSNKQDYTTLGVLGKMDQYKSQQKLESFNKLN